MSVSNKNTLYLNGFIYGGYGLFTLFAPKLFTSIYFKSDVPMNDEVYNAWQFCGTQYLVISALNFAVARNGTKAIQKAVCSGVAMGCTLGLGIMINNNYKERSDAPIWYQVIALYVGLGAINAYFAFFQKDEK